MAFSETQKDAIRRYLGYPAGFRDLSTRLESMMNTVGTSAVEQASVEAILNELDAIDAALETVGAQTQSMGALKKVDEVEFYEATGSVSTDAPTSIKRGRMLVRRLARRFGVASIEDYFGTGPGMGFQLSVG